MQDLADKLNSSLEEASIVLARPPKPTLKEGPLLPMSLPEHEKRVARAYAQPLCPRPDHAAESAREFERDNPERETLLLAATGAATVLGPSHSATRAFARAAATMDRVDMWHARLALRTLRLDQRQAIAAVAED